VFPCVRAYVAVDAEKLDALLSFTADACGCKQSERSKLRGSFERFGGGVNVCAAVSWRRVIFLVQTDIDIPGNGNITESCKQKR